MIDYQSLFNSGRFTTPQAETLILLSQRILAEPATLGATLAALAATSWAADAIPVGTGPGAVTQLALPANTFLARSSAGPIAPKTLSDFALTLLDDTSAAAMRATIGAGTGNGTVTSVNLGASTGLTPSGGPITGAGSLTYTLSANLLGWNAIAPASKQDALGYVPVNRAGDTMTGLLIASQAGAGTEAIRISNVTDSKRLHLAAGTAGAQVRSENSDLLLNAADAGTIIRLNTQGATRVSVSSAKIDSNVELEIAKNVPAVSLNAYNDGHIELLTTDLSKPRIGFHIVGSEAIALYYNGGNSLKVINNSGVDSTLWHSNNDGAGSGMDADLLDGVQGAAYSRTASPTTHGGTLMSRDHRGSTDAPSFWGSKGLYQDFKTAAEAGMATGTFASVSTHVMWDDDSGGGIHQMVYSDTGSLWRRYGTRGGGWGTMRVVWDSGNDGAGSGMDADLLDGVQGDNFVQGTGVNRTGNVENLNTAMPSGFFESTPTGSNGPAGAVWHWYLNIRHSNTGNHYAGQIANPIGSDDFYTRYINAGTPGSWRRLAKALVDETFRDITASRGDGTGVLFFTGSRYLYYDGAKYDLPGAPLTVGGAISDVRGDVRDMPLVGSLTPGCMWDITTGQTLNTGLTAGRVYGIYNNSGASITLTQGGGLTLRKSRTATTGNMTLEQRGMAFLWCRSTTEYVIDGVL